jgi:ligand-binding SRPBCC domain-containing protein
MIRGVFHRFCHDHYFETRENNTLMKDVMEFEAPLGPLGKVVDKLLLARHMQRLLERRNQCIRQAAESQNWKAYIGS